MHYSNLQTPKKTPADSIQRLVRELGKLPGIGEKTAMRLADHLIKQPLEEIEALTQALTTAKQELKLCSTCYSFTDQEICTICSDSTRNRNQICVVERPADARSLEYSQSFKGLYHVLHGVLSPLDGIGPDQLRIRELLERISIHKEALEIVFALNPSTESDATLYYIAKLIRTIHTVPHAELSRSKMTVTQIAQGLPSGGHLQYSDRSTLGKALENRQEVKVF
jgi:recombination protein RecR